MDRVGSTMKSDDLNRLKGIGITNQRETTILWDSTTGKPLHNAIVWSDGRTAEVVERVIGSKTKDHLRVVLYRACAALHVM